ncbi:MAG: response regulator [Alicyclobacillus macrosporangiidus]|uniref:response regulator n=1 Tax=Alicyclobacillus macrosporangiidus TaxID=392015 RepID=UPI0026EFADB5|nr:response regulator [Alicyclobacillus macrosporangiidus]MCL6600195.1 response regulator [Alicyclobacillus macrosporangiidus]
MAKILIADDSAFMRMMLKNILTEGGHEIVAEAANGREVIDLYRSHHPDIVTLDITMPEMDGLEALKVLKASYPEAKVIMCSAMGQQNMVIEAIQSGAISFIVKPFKKEKVLEVIAKLV